MTEKIDTFKDCTENTDKMIDEINGNISKFAKRATKHDNKMNKLQKHVDDFTFAFNNKIDRLLKDVAHRFSNFTKTKAQLESLQTNFDCLKKNGVRYASQ